MKFSGKLRLYNDFPFSFTALYFTKVKLVVQGKELKLWFLSQGTPWLNKVNTPRSSTLT